MKRFKVEFEFNTLYDAAQWDWEDLLKFLDDDTTDVDLDSVRLFRNDWKLVVNGRA